MAIKLLMICIAILTLVCAFSMVYRLKQAPREKLSFIASSRIFGCGVLAFIADTLGIGSFAVNTALAKLLGTFKDEEIPGMNNGAQVLPGAISAFFFIHYIDVDIITLLTLVISTSIGGMLGGTIVSKMNKQNIRVAMISCFSLIIVILSTKQLGILKIGGNATALYTWDLAIGAIGIAICGMLSAAGVGLFALVQGVLFLLNMSPIVAFPIMMAAGAIQQPLTTLVFLKWNKIPLKKTLILSTGGCLGVLVIIPVFKYLTISWLHSLLILVLIYNVYSISKSYLQTRSESKHELVDMA